MKEYKTTEIERKVLYNSLNFICNNCMCNDNCKRVETKCIEYDNIKSVIDKSFSRYPMSKYMNDTDEECLRLTWVCPTCENTLSCESKEVYCKHCGQRLNWEEE